MTRPSFIACGRCFLVRRGFTTPSTTWLSQTVAKAILTVLVGIAHGGLQVHAAGGVSEAPPKPAISLQPSSSSTMLVGGAAPRFLVAQTRETPPKAANVPEINGRVHPAALQGTARLELGQLILLLLPGADTELVGWDHASDSVITWVTDGYQERKLDGGGVVYERNGLIRVHVGGEISTVIRKQKEELGWTVRYSNGTNPKFGPRKIELEPGLPGEPCFGSRYVGCWFDEPLKSLRAAGVGARRLCTSSFASERISAFRLTYSGRRPTVLMWAQSGGSGGVTASISLQLNTEPSAGLCRATMPLTPDEPERAPIAVTKPSANSPPSTAAEAARFYELDVRTNICMRESATAFLRMGQRDSNSIVASQVAMCAGPLVTFLTRTARPPLTDDQAGALAAAMAHQQLGRALAVGR